MGMRRLTTAKQDLHTNLSLHVTNKQKMLVHNCLCRDIILSKFLTYKTQLKKKLLKFLCGCVNMLTIAL